VEPTGSRALDRGDIAFGGEADGEGELVPPPLSPTLQLSYFSSPPLPCLRRDTRTFSTGSPHPARAFAEGYPDTSAGTSPTHACGAPPPPPLGAGQCPGVYQVSSRIRGVAGGKPYTGPWWLSPLGDSTIGGQNFPKINNVRKDRVDVVFIWWVC